MSSPIRVVPSLTVKVIVPGLPPIIIRVRVKVRVRVGVRARVRS